MVYFIDSSRDAQPCDDMSRPNLNRVRRGNKYRGAERARIMRSYGVRYLFSLCSGGGGGRLCSIAKLTRKGRA